LGRFAQRGHCGSWALFRPRVLVAPHRKVGRLRLLCVGRNHDGGAVPVKRQELEICQLRGSFEEHPPESTTWPSRPTPYFDIQALITTERDGYYS
jgi:hypothetical protein